MIGTLDKYSGTYSYRESHRSGNITNAIIEDPEGEMSPCGLTSDAAFGSRGDTDSIADVRRELDSLKDVREKVADVPSPKQKAASADSTNTMRANIAKRLRDIVSAVGVPGAQHRGTRLELFWDYCVQAHRSIGGGDQEDFLSLVAWLEGATAAGTWKRFTREQWDAVQKALNAAYIAANYDFEAFSAAKRNLKAVGLRAVPDAFTVEG